MINTNNNDINQWCDWFCKYDWYAYLIY